MMLPCVRTKCTNCGVEAYLSAGVVARAHGRQLTDHTAALIPRAIRCLECGSNQVDVYYTHQKTAIVVAGKTPCCRICHNYIPELFSKSFPLAYFCPLCVAEGHVSDAQVAASYGELVAVYGKSVAGEAYRFMSIALRADEGLKLKWLRKAADEGDIHACASLGDFFSRSDNPADLANAISFYERVAGASGPVSTIRDAENRLALMLFTGRGRPADPVRAVELMLSSAAKGASYSLSDLGKFYLNGDHGLVPDAERAFELYRKAYAMMSHTSMTVSTAVALMLLEGIGTKPDEDEGARILRHAISVYADRRPKIDQDVCFREVMAVRRLADGEIADLPIARVYLDWMRGNKIAAGLLDRCGGPLPPHEPRWELSLSRALPDKVNCDIWWVQSPIRDGLGQPVTLGQVESLPTRRWIATTEAGVPIGDTFGSEKEAVGALAAALGCEVPYIDRNTRLNRLQTRN